VVAVRPVSSVRRYTGLDQDAVQAGKELGVEAVLDGSIQRVGERIRVTARLVRVSDGRQLWAGQFDEKFTDIFAVQDAICERVAGELSLNLAGGKRELLTKRPTANAEAYQLYLKGRYHWYKSTPEDSLKAREYFQQAIDVDPSFALAYSGLADFYGRASALGQMRPDEGWPRHEAAVRKALELDPNIAEVHNSLAGLRLYYYRDVPGAESEFKRAIELDPNYVEARAHYGGYLTLIGRFDEAVAQSKRAQELDPLSPGISRRFGRTLFHARRYDEAIQQFLRALELNPGYTLAHEDLGDAYEQKKMYGEAVAAWREAMTLSRNDELAATLERAYKKSGYEGAVKAASQKRLEQLVEKARRGEFVPAMDFVRLYVRLGDKEQAFAWLEKAYGERTRLIFNIKVDPLFDDLSADPRFADLLRRLNLM
jgi:tetratricopeptide (TPR) repeat protein